MINNVYNKNTLSKDRRTYISFLFNITKSNNDNDRIITKVTFTYIYCGKN